MATTDWSQEAGMAGEADIDNVQDLAGQAAQSASDALDSENAASQSATAAADSATTANQHKVAAENAKNSAETAQGLAETAQGLSESARDAALGHSNTASGHATTATTQAGMANTSALAATNQAFYATEQALLATTKAGEAATSETNAAASATAAATAYDNFDDRYLGSKPSDPALDNDGDALLTGALYFNSTDDVMKVYDGASWVVAYASIAGITLDDVTNDGSTTTNAITVGGLTSTGAVILNADPSSNLGAATKQYVDTIAAAGIHYHNPVRVEQEGNLTATYDNGSSGVGATLTNSSTQEALVIDGVTLLSGDRVLIYEQTNQAQNGIYTVTDVGSGSTNWVLTRAVDADSYAPSDPDSFGQGDAFFVQEGLLGAGETYVMTTEGPITFGTTAIHFSQISSAQVYSGSTGIDITGTTISSTATLADVTTAGSSTTNSITVGGVTSTGLVTASNLNTSNWDTAYGWGNHASAGYYVNGAIGFASTGIDDNATSTAITIDASGKITAVTGTSSSAPIITATAAQGQEAGIKIHREGTTRSGLSLFTEVSGVESDVLYCDSDGNVGIGTGSSTSGTGSAGKVLKVETAITGPELVLKNSTSSPGLGAFVGGVALQNASNTSGVWATSDAFGTTYLHLGTDSGYGSQTGAVTIAPNGNVGIDITNPSEKLNVSGNILATGNVTASGGNSTNWNTAYGWGNHASAGYLTSSFNVATGSSDSDPNTNTSAYFLTNHSNSPFIGLYSHIQNHWWSSNGSNAAQHATTYNGTGARFAVRHRYSGSWTPWAEALTTSNYTSYSPTLTGSGASGTWGISITGNAATATNATNVTGISRNVGDFGSISANTTRGGYYGLSCNGHLVLMSNGSAHGIYDDANNDWWMTFTENGGVVAMYNGTARVTTTNAGATVTGALTATGNVTAYSDERLKSDIETLDGSKVYEMRGVSFTKDGEASSGVIAQELQKVAPELVHEGEEYLSVAYGNLVGYLIEAVKELKAEIDELKGAK
jgi:hypothetical protein